MLTTSILLKILFSSSEISHTPKNLCTKLKYEPVCILMEPLQSNNIVHTPEGPHI